MRRVLTIVAPIAIDDLVTITEALLPRYPDAMVVHQPDHPELVCIEVPDEDAQ